MNKSIKLDTLSKNSLNERKMNELRGGKKDGSCGCGCAGTSSTTDNLCANSDKGLHSGTNSDI